VNRLLCKNFGSIAAGAFLNAFLNLFGIFFDIVRVILLQCSAIRRAVSENPTKIADQYVAAALLS